MNLKTFVAPSLKKLLLFFVLFSGISTLQAQWITQFENEAILVESYETLCEKPERGEYAEYHYLRIKNKTSEQLNAKLRFEIDYGDVCIGCDNGRESYRSYYLNPNEIIEGSCDAAMNGSLHIFKKWTKVPNVRTLQSFKIYDFQLIPNTTPDAK